MISPVLRCIEHTGIGTDDEYLTISVNLDRKVEKCVTLAYPFDNITLARALYDLATAIGKYISEGEAL